MPTIGGSISAANAVMPAGGFDQRGRPGLFGCEDKLPLHARHDVLSFQTEPLAQSIDVTAPVSVRVWVSASSPDTDLTAKLLDVYPPSVDYPVGYALNLQDGILRLRYRNDRSRPELMIPGEIYQVDIVLAPTSNLFGRGHRIRLDLSSSNYPGSTSTPTPVIPSGPASARFLRTSPFTTTPSTLPSAPVSCAEALGHVANGIEITAARRGQRALADSQCVPKRSAGRTPCTLSLR